MHYVNKVKSYFNFHIKNLKKEKEKKGVQIILIGEQHSERNNL